MCVVSDKVIWSDVKNRSTNWAEFVIFDDKLSGSEIRQRLDIPDGHIERVGDWFQPGGTRRQGVLSTFSVRSINHIDRHRPIEQHLQRLMKVIKPTVPQLRVLHADGAGFLLRIIRFMDTSEHRGHGIRINRDWIGLLAELDGMLDIDQNLGPGQSR